MTSGLLERDRDPGPGLDHLRAAVTATGGSRAQLEHGRALVTLGAARRRSGQRREARDPLRYGLEVAGRCGATGLAELARAELLAAGARPRREAVTGPAALTPSERRVVELAAEGRRNRDIARLLHVTPKTVEIHLTSVYRKLGISSRAALPDVL